MDKKEILDELKKQFDLTKEKLKFKSSFEEVNEIAFLEDMVLSQGYVSNQLSRQMVNRMTDTFYGWVGVIHSWVFPPQMDLIYSNESKNLTKEERKELYSMIDKIMYLVRKNKRIAFENSSEESKFIDEVIDFDKKIFSPFMSKYLKRFEEFWKNESQKENSKNIPSNIQ